jgi:hypothetical protein
MSVSPRIWAITSILCLLTVSIASANTVPVAGLWSQPTGSSQVVDGQAHALLRVLMVSHATCCQK